MGFVHIRLHQPADVAEMTAAAFVTARAAKLSIALPASLAKAVRKRVGARGLSRFFAQAVAHELEREQLGAFIAELDLVIGPPSKAALAAARRAWPKRSSSMLRQALRRPRLRSAQH